MYKSNRGIVEIKLVMYINFSSKIEEFLASDKDELTIDKCNAFIRRLVYQEARIRWPNKLRIEGKVENTWQCLLVQKIGTEDEEEEKDNQKRDKEKLELTQAVGLSNLLRKIVESVSTISITEKSVCYALLLFQ